MEVQGVLGGNIQYNPIAERVGGYSKNPGLGYQYVQGDSSIVPGSFSENLPLHPDNFASTLSDGSETW